MFRRILEGRATAMSPGRVSPVEGSEPWGVRSSPSQAALSVVVSFLILAVASLNVISGNRRSDYR
jgi:hypothetical protein